MKILNERVKPDGSSVFTVSVPKGETLMAVRDNAHYRLGHPLDDVVGGHIVSAAQEVSWCVVEQKWV